MTNTTKVKVQVVVEITTGSRWGDDCSLKHIYNQGQREAIEILARTIDGAPIAVLRDTIRVLAVTTAQDQ